MQRSRRIRLLAAVLACSSSTLANAATTGVTGGSLPIENRQRSLGLNYLVRVDGPFDRLGEIILSADGVVPGGYARADGATLSIQNNINLFNKLGDTYGGNGQTTFALPNLLGRTAIGAGQGLGLTNRPLGSVAGSDQAGLINANLPAHSHVVTTPGGPVNTSSTGGSQPFDNLQPSLAVNYGITALGIFPTPNSGAPISFVGQLRMFGGPVSNDSIPATGGAISISENDTLFNLIGTKFGGDGQQTFNAPDLRGRAVAGVSSTAIADPHALAGTFGAEQRTIGVNNLPPHTHSTASNGPTSSVGGGAAINDEQPTMTLHYLIATEGYFPDPNGSPPNSSIEDPFYGQIALFAGNFVPRGWAEANGQLLPIAQNQTLFSLLGTQFGGNGQTTFALPDLRSYIPIGAMSANLIGEKSGFENLTLSLSQMPAHAHEYVVPEPTMMLGAMSAMALLRRRR